jgi:hypothetical protein
MHPNDLESLKIYRDRLVSEYRHPTSLRKRRFLDAKIAELERQIASAANVIDLDYERWSRAMFPSSV